MSDKIYWLVTGSLAKAPDKKGFFMIDSVVKEVLYNIIIRAVLSPGKEVGKG
jgi:hypothetical protein